MPPKKRSGAPDGKEKTQKKKKRPDNARDDDDDDDANDADVDSKKNVASSSAVPAAAGTKAAFVPKAFVKLYRTTPVGKALTESLDELLATDRIDEETAMQILNQFDASMFFALRAKARTELKFNGHLDEYRLVDNVWTWLLTNVSLTFGARTVRTPRLKVVAMKAYEPNQ
jgi:transcription initiation factor TFIIA small subunit